MVSALKDDATLFLYADDSAILCSGRDTASISNILQRSLDGIGQWLIDNRLTMHPGKTEAILFGSNPKLKASTNLTISYKSQAIQNKKRSEIFRRSIGSVSKL